DSLAWGAGLSAWVQLNRERFYAFGARYRGWLLAGGALAFLPTFIWDLGATKYHHTIGYTVLAWGGMALIAATAGWQALDRWWLSRVVGRIGQDSYSIYLWHVPLAASILPAGWVAPLPVLLVVWLILIVGIGIAMAKLVEWPSLKIRDRWFPG